MRRSRLRIASVLLGVLVVHLTVLANVRISDVRPEVMLLFAVLAGTSGGPERGAVGGFAAGLAADLFVQTPFGLSALTYCLVGFAVGSLQTAVLRSAWWIPVLTAFLGTGAGLLLYALLGAVVGRTEFLTPSLAVVALVAGIMNALVAPLLLPAVVWAYRNVDPARPYVHA